MSTTATVSRAAEQARFVQQHLPPGGLLAGETWRICPTPFPLGAHLSREIETLGRVLLQFYRAVNLLYRQSVLGKQPRWVANYLDQGKDPRLVEWQRHPSFKNDLPRVIRPDLLLTENGFAVSELDSVPGGIGLTAWLNQTYSRLRQKWPPLPAADKTRLHDEAVPVSDVIGGPDGMLQGFAGIFGQAPRAHIVISAESASYRPEMEWLAGQINDLGQSAPIDVRDSDFTGFAQGDAVYRFFELFDLPNIKSGETLLHLAQERQIQLTPPFKPVFEEKMLFALLWNRNLRGFWRQELGESFLHRLLAVTPYTWIVDPTPLPPHAALPTLDLTDWHQLKTLSQRERDLILKVSGYSERAWGARGVFLGSDLPLAEWSAAVDGALTAYPRSPYVLQRYQKPRVIPAHYFDFDKGTLLGMNSRVRLCPYYFVIGDGDAARPHLGGILATICPADKKIIHGMDDAVLAPCAVQPD